MQGATERIDVFGDVAIPLYEDEVRQAARELLPAGSRRSASRSSSSYRNSGPRGCGRRRSFAKWWRRRGREVARLPRVGSLSAAPGLPAPEHADSRGVRGGAGRAAAAEGAGRGPASTVRTSTCGSWHPRGHDLDRCARACQDADLGPDRRRDRRPLSRRAARAPRTSSAQTSAAPASTWR